MKAAGISKILVLFIGVAVLFSCRLHGQTELPAQADKFVDSAGVNVHLGYTDTLYYTNFPLIQSSLANLGVRHVRDDEPINAAPGFYANHSSLLSYGIHGEFATQITELPSDLAGYPALFSPGYFEAFEPPNECDANSNCGSPWAANLTAYLPVLAANRGTYPVYGPSFASPLGAPAIGDASAYTSLGNMHYYGAGWNPGYPGQWGYGHTNYLSIGLAISLAATTNPSQPSVMTETGYTNAIAPQTPQLGYPAGANMPYDANSIPENIAATYMPRVLLNCWMNGVSRTYLYELLSSPGQDYGLLRGDGSIKPAFMAVSNLLKLLQDPGPSFTVQPLTYTLSGGDASLEHLLLQKRDGTYYLALWLESSGYNKWNNSVISVPLQTISLTTSYPVSAATSYSWDDQGQVTTAAVPLPLSVSAGASVTVLELSSVNAVSAVCKASTLTQGGATSCAATVSGTGNLSSAVNWSTSSGSIDSSGNFKAPASGTSVTLQATSVQDPTRVGTFAIKLTSAAPVLSMLTTVTTATTATVTWTSSQLTNNGVDYGVNKAYGGITPYAFQTSQSPSFTITGLKSKTTYYILVFSKNPLTGLTGTATSIFVTS